MALFESFFSRRENIGDADMLATVAGRAGLDSSQAREVLAQGRYVSAVRDEQARWLERDVHAVPMFYFNDSYPVPGAQDSQTFVKVLRKVIERSGAGATG